MTNQNKRKGTLQTNTATQIDVRYTKLPPQDLSLERAVLGILMLEPKRTSEIMDLMKTAEIFYDSKHRKVFEAVLSLYNSGIQVDSSTLMIEMKKQNTLEFVGGAYFFTELMMDVVSSGHVITWVGFLIEMYKRRKLIEVAGYILSEAYEMNIPSSELITNAYIRIGEFSEDAGQREVKTMEQLQMQKVKELEEAMNAKRDVMGGSTGLPDLDRLLYGLESKRFGVIAARPAVGKTAFMLQLARGLANDPHKENKVVIYSLEMDGVELSERNLSSTSQVTLNQMRKASTLTEQQIKQMLTATQSFPANKIYVDDSVVSDWRSLVGRIAKMKEKHGITHVFLDYLQLMSNSERGGNREQEVASISRQLKLAAKSMDIHICTLCQLSRESEKRGDLKPKLSDLRESGAIEQDADWVIGLYKPTAEMIEQGANENARAAAVIKNRSGDTGENIYVWDGATQTFSMKDHVHTMPTEMPIYDNPRAGFQQSNRLPENFNWED